MREKEMDHQPARRIALFSRVLKYGCVLVMGYFCIITLFALNLPVVRVMPTYFNPARPSSEAPRMNGGTEVAETPSPDGNHLVLNLSDSAPTIQVFSYTPGPSALRRDREWLGKISAISFFLYHILGGVLLFRLFQSYERLKIFELESANRLKWVGIWLIGLIVTRQLYEISKLFWSEDSGVTVYLFGGMELYFGLFILVIAWVMKEACKLADEQSLTV